MGTRRTRAGDFGANAFGVILGMINSIGAVTAGMSGAGQVCAALAASAFGAALAGGVGGAVAGAVAAATIKPRVLKLLSAALQVTRQRV